MLNIISGLFSSSISSDLYYTTTTYSDADAAAAVGFLGTYMLCMFVLAFIIYIVVAIAQMRMASKLGNEDIKWFSFIPFLNTWLLGKMAKQDTIFIVLAILFSPISLYFYYEIFTKRYGKDAMYFFMWFLALIFFFPVALWMLWSLSGKDPVA